MRVEYILLCAIVIIVLTIGIYLFFRNRENKLLNALQDMIDDMSQGNLQVNFIDESKMSALANSLKRYLADSELAKENQSLQRKKIQTLISDISHQTITPISNILLYSQLLEESSNGGEEITAIREQAEKLDFLIQALVKSSRMETGIITVAPKENKISEIMESLQNQFYGKAEKNNITLEIEKTEIIAKFDLKWTTEAVANVVDNALKYTPPGGMVRISALRYNLFARIDVRDTGIGIAMANQSKIFTRFYRELEVSNQEGVGIGLYLSREIMQAQKGYIKVVSEKEKGSLFSIFLPLV